MIEFQCEGCYKTHRVKDELAGHSAKCTCGARIKVPTPATPPALANDDLFDELAAPSMAPTASLPPVRAKSLADTARNVDVNAVLRKAGETAASDPSEAWPGWLPAVGKVGAGGLIGMFIGLRAMLRNANQAALSHTVQIACICGAGVAGALAASLLLVADAARQRKAAGQYVPLPVRLFFASGWLSLLLWIAAAFLGAIILAIVLA